MKRLAAAFALLVVVVIAVATLFAVWTLTSRYAGSVLSSSEAVPARRVALVFGAGYWRDGTPSDVLKDRVEAAVDLLKAGRVEKLLFSGDNSSLDYNEPGTMRDYALTLGCPATSIVLDYAGRRTYDSCYRARFIFGQQNLVLVTQRYHLPRALYICKSLGIEAVGYAADRRQYVHIRDYWLREVPALWLAWVDRWIRQPLPVLGDPIQV